MYSLSLPPPPATVRKSLPTIAKLAMQGAPYMVRIKCSSCGEASDKHSFVDPAAEVEVPGGRGHANLVQKCKLCSRQCNVKFVPGSAAPYAA